MKSARTVTPDQFRPDDPEIQKDPYPYYTVLRDQAPVLKSKFGDQPCWILSRREDIGRVLMDPATFSSRTTAVPNMLFSDPPEHGRLRKMVAHMFTRTAVQPVAPQIKHHAESLIEAQLATGRCDIINDFAGPLTVALIGLVLGIPVFEVERLRELTRLQMEYVGAIRLGREPSREARLASEGLIQFVTELVRAENYDNGRVVSVLADLVRHGELTGEECAQYVVMLLIAGHSTTTNLIGNAVYVLSQRPGDLDRMKDDEAFTTSFVEEVLRTRPSFHRNIRITTRDVDVSGQTIPAGSVVRLLLASANRDAAYFDDPESFDPDEKRRTHFAFGQGIHTCLGAWLARLEASTALRVFSRRVASVAIDPEKPLVCVSGGTFNEFGFEHLPVLLSPRVLKREDAEAVAF